VVASHCRHGIAARFRGTSCGEGGSWSRRIGSLSVVLENNCHTSSRTASRHRQCVYRFWPVTGSGRWLAIWRGSHFQIWMASLLRRTRLGESGVAASVVCVDAHSARKDHVEGSAGFHGHHKAAFRLGHLLRSLLRQLFSIFHSHLAAVLSGSRAGIFSSTDGTRRRRLFCGKCNFVHAGRLALRSLDRIGCVSHPSTQRSDDRGGLLLRTVPSMLCCSPRLGCIVCLLLTAAAFGVGAANLWAITQRLAGAQAVGRWCGIQLFVGNLSGVVAPALTGFLVDRTAHFFWPFLVTSAILWIGALSWRFVVGPIEPVCWPAIATDLTLSSKTELTPRGI